MNRPVLVSVVAVVLLLAVGFALVLVAERPGPPPARAATEPPPAPLAEAAPVAPRIQAPAPAVPAAPPSRAAAPPAAPEERRIAEEPLREEVFRGLVALDERVLGCGLARPQVFLVLESLEGRVRVVEARPPVRSRPGGAAEEPERPAALACMRGVLEGAVLEAPSAQPGLRWNVLYAPGAMR